MITDYCKLSSASDMGDSQELDTWEANSYIHIGYFYMFS